MRIAIPVIIAACFICACSIPGACERSSKMDEYFVATDGNDAWSGKLPKPNKAKTDGPFATIERARDALRSRKDRSVPAVVSLRKGTYFLDKTFVLGPDDSGPVTYQAYGKERVTISGGRRIEGLCDVVVNGKKMLAANIPEVNEGKWYFTQLFVNNRRRSRTKLPKKDYYRIAEVPDAKPEGSWAPGQDNFKFNAGEISASWRNLGDVDIVVPNFWMESRMQIKSVDEAGNLVQLNKPSVTRLWDDWQGPVGARYWIENVFEALDTPGQWYLDRPTGTLYYYPFPGEDVRKLTVIAPRLEQLVIVGEGLAEGQRLSGIKFQNLGFAHTEPVHPKEASGYPQAAFGVPGAVQFLGATDCSISNCDVSGIGTYAVEVGPGGGKSPWGKPTTTAPTGPACVNIKIERNRMVDLGAGGVKIQPDSAGTLVADNEIGDGGKIFASAIGVWIGNTPDNTVTHNHIHDLDYTGVSVGWTWGYGETKTKNNIVEFNHIHHVGRKVLSDLAGIYTLGTQPGSALRNNLIHDCYSYSYGGWGTYTDEGSSFIVIENNVVYNTKTGGHHQHYGKENVIRNNVYAFSQQQQLQRSREEEHISFSFERNIVYYDEGVLLGSNWNNKQFKMDYNCYWDASGKPVTFVGKSFEEWKKLGFDEHSIIADPLFVDPKKRDFTLKPDSPAFKLGFKAIDVSTVGPRGPVGPIM